MASSNAWRSRYWRHSGAVMWRLMFTSCGIQWLAQPARYFSHAHLYLKGTSWFTSVAPLITRLSAACTRVAAAVDSTGSAIGADGIGAAEGMREATAGCRAGVKSSSKFSIVLNLLWLHQSGPGPHYLFISRRAT